jgi:hypothetical protein
MFAINNFSTSEFKGFMFEPECFRDAALSDPLGLVFLCCDGKSRYFANFVDLQRCVLDFDNIDNEDEYNGLVNLLALPDDNIKEPIQPLIYLGSHGFDLAYADQEDFEDRRIEVDSQSDSDDENHWDPVHNIGEFVNWADVEDDDEEFMLFKKKKKNVKMYELKIDPPPIEDAVSYEEGDFSETDLGDEPEPQLSETYNIEPVPAEILYDYKPISIFTLHEIKDDAQLFDAISRFRPEDIQEIYKKYDDLVFMYDLETDTSRSMKCFRSYVKAYAENNFALIITSLDLSLTFNAWHCLEEYIIKSRCFYFN